MYTQCPSCDAIYPVNARQLRTARGRVRCGRCLNTFDGIAHLSDVPIRRDSRARSEHPPASDSAATHEPMPGQMSEPVPGQSEPMPEVLRYDLALMDSLRRARRRVLGYSLASALLLTVLVLQVAWFMPEEVQRRYPQARPWLDRFCTISGCELPEARLPREIRVVNRDVRLHPRYEGALQITVAFVNAATRRQPYPRLQFTLFNVNGETMASRIFTPEEYLSPELAVIGAGMKPNEPLQISLEVLAPEQVAVSYEFQFL